MNLLLNRNFQLLYIVILSTAVLCNDIKAQQKKSNLIMGKIVSSENKSPVTYAMIINTTSKQNVYSDSLGYFSIPVSINDTLMFTRIGFFTKEMQISESLINLKKVHLIELNERSYELNAVSINNLGTYQDFKYKVIHSELPKDENQINPAITKALNEKVVVLQPQANISLGSPVTALYNLLSKEGKSLRKLEKEKEKDRIVASYKDKYSPEIISELTGLKEIELEKFMKYCNPDVNFLKSAIEYEIAAKIMECLKNYKSEQEKQPVP